MTKENIKIKADCSKCGENTNAEIQASHDLHWDYDYKTVQGCVEYRIIQCCGCETVYFQTSSTCSEDV